MRASLIRNLFTALVLLAVCVGVSFGQTTSSPQLDEQLKGRIKTSLTTWTFLVYAGRSVPNIQVPIDFVQYDERGRLEYEIDFGKDGINRRTTYNRIDGKTTVEIAYFDKSGKEIPPDRVKFSPNAGLTEQKGLCTEFVVRCEIIAPSNDRRYTEICTDGTIRATELEQFDENDRIIRSVREDSLNRTWEEKLAWDDSGNLISLRWIVNDGIRPAFWLSNEYSDFQRDARGSLTGKFASVVNSTFSGVSHQFIENRTIEYYP